MSSNEYLPARRTTTPSPVSSHSMTDPGPMPSRRLTSAGMETWPCDVILDCAIAMPFTLPW